MARQDFRRRKSDAVALWMEVVGEILGVRAVTPAAVAAGGNSPILSSPKKCVN